MQSLSSSRKGKARQGKDQQEREEEEENDEGMAHKITIVMVEQQLLPPVGLCFGFLHRSAFVVPVHVSVWPLFLVVGFANRISMEQLQ